MSERNVHGPNETVEAKKMFGSEIQVTVGPGLPNTSSESLFCESHEQVKTKNSFILEPNRALPNPSQGMNRPLYSNVGKPNSQPRPRAGPGAPLPQIPGKKIVKDRLINQSRVPVAFFLNDLVS